MKKYFLILLLSSCTLVPDYEQPKIATAEKFSQDQNMQNGSEVTKNWWREFQNPELNSLINQSLEHNTDLSASLQQIAQARANAKIAGSDLYPTIDASATASRTTQYNHLSGSTANFGNSNRSRESLGLGLDISYEIDLWGRNRARAESAEVSAKATQYDYDALSLVVASDTANYYAQFLSLNDRIRIAQQNLANARDVLKVIQAQYDAGAVSGLELAQQNASLSSFETGINSLKDQRNVTITQLAILTGQTPEGFNLKGGGLNELSLPSIKALQPGELVERRPDIKAAEEQLIAANIDIGVARAEMFPSLQIGAGPALAAISTSSPVTFSNALFASITAPLFRGGALEGNLELTRARKEELVSNYTGVVLASLKEVEDALSGVATSKLNVVSSANSIVNSQKA